MSPLSILATVVGIMMALAGLPQAIKIYKRKSAGDISAVTYLIIGIGAVVWVFYGFEIKSFAVIISNALGALTSTFVLIEYYLFRKTTK